MPVKVYLQLEPSRCSFGKDKAWSSSLVLEDCRPLLHYSCQAKFSLLATVVSSILKISSKSWSSARKPFKFGGLGMKTFEMLKQIDLPGGC